MSQDIVQSILIVDDEEPICSLLEECLNNQSYATDKAGNADEALKKLRARQFDLVLSDVRMPGMDGISLLRTITREYPDVGVLMLTACEDISMAVEAMKLGALDYLLKPFWLDDVVEAVRKALVRQRERVQQRRYVLQLEAVLRRQTLELRRTFEQLHDASDIALEALVAALDAREHETKAHSKRVSWYTLHLAKQMKVDRSLLVDMSRGAMLHDIGKIGVSDNILLKPGELNENEWTEMRKHPEIGFWILDGIEGLRSAAQMVLEHQERFDGSGYPGHLKGEDIPIGARIFSVIDCFDAVTSDRPYRKGSNYEKARDEILRCAGTQFDPEVVKHFLRVPKETWMEIRAQSQDESGKLRPQVNC